MQAPAAFKYSTVPKKRIQWLWYPFIQRGAINLLTGGPGTGKSTIACDIAAALSRARPLPGESAELAKARGHLKTWIFNAEDDPQDTIVWRLENQDADLDLIYGRPLTGPISEKNIQEITAFIAQEKIALIVVDPVQAWIPPDTDMHRANQMRDWGNLFRRLCLETDVTVLWVRHRRKGDADDQNSLNSGLGSIDMSGIVRSEIGALVTKKGSRITRIKGSVGPTGVDLSYSIESTDNDHGQLSWSAATQPKASAETAAPRKNPLDSWLIGLLIDGPRAKKDIIDRAAALGYGPRTVQRRADEIVFGFYDGGIRKWRLRTPQDGKSNESIDDEAATDDST